MVLVELLEPAASVALRPRLADPTLEHRSERVTMGQGERDVTEYDDKNHRREYIVDEGGSGPPVNREEPKPLQYRAGAEHHDDRATGKDRVELLAGVELVGSDEPLHSERPQPANFGSRPHVDPPEITAKPCPPRTRERDDQRNR